MSGAGGFLGAIAGVLLVLLSRVITGVGVGMVVLVPASVAFGALLAMTLGVMLASRQSLSLAWQPRFISFARPKSDGEVTLKV
jgi:uncharacterized membrane protein